MLYVGIAPKKPSRDGQESKSRLRTRVRYHYRGNAAGSTLRLTLGCLLADRFGIELRRVGSGERLTFTKQGEPTISEWMAENAYVCWIEDEKPWDTEDEVIARYDVPPNLDKNQRNIFHPELSRIRAERRKAARLLPVLPR